MTPEAPCLTDLIERHGPRLEELLVHVTRVLQEHRYVLKSKGKAGGCAYFVKLALDRCDWNALVYLDLQTNAASDRAILRAIAHCGPTGLGGEVSGCRWTSSTKDGDIRLMLAAIDAGNFAATVSADLLERHSQDRPHDWMPPDAKRTGAPS